MIENHATDEMWSSVESGGTNGRAAPCARGKHSATLLGGHVYVLGGRGAGGAVPLRDFWSYSLATGKWEKLECRGDPPPSLQEHSATAHENKLYVFGGEAGALSNETPLWIYDTETQVWRKLPGQSNYTSTLRRRSPRDARGAALGPRGRRGHSAHALKDCLLIYGGYKDLRGSTHELWAFHYESESWHQVRTASPGPARHRHAAALHDNRLYVHGGQCDLRDCADLWYYDTMSRVWSQVRTPAKLAPSARSGHAGLRAGAHLYIFGGETHGHSTNELWRFHFATETWERIVQSLKWPSPRVDSCALLIPAAPPRVRSAPANRLGPNRHSMSSRPDPPASLLKEISKLSSFHIRRAARCSYSVLAGERDSTESLVRQEAAALSKSHSAYIIDKRQPADGDESPREGDVPEFRSEMSREPISVPDFADMILPTPVLSPVEATKLVYLDSEDEEDMKREISNMKKKDGITSVKLDGKVTVVTIPKSASVRFTKDTIITDEEDTELSTSDYASAERVNRLSGNSLGFSNPHYLGPDVRNLGAALTPDSGVGPGDIELQDLGERRARSVPRNGETQLHLLLVGGKEPPHLALLQNPLSMWTYRLL
ncbi:unnamed protein product [Spodoptera littoralis]|uniref:Uncharacterized protein n=1 Tax=Spodoptera littoralis TaxID=7109 RepID=A0A9P0I1G8_SPOLI|nr:unnamed protein product [Spodoptera littoralis]CAH1638453.1 unnamed protein product [Spodoptera littoralis]